MDGYLRRYHGGDWGSPDAMKVYLSLGSNMGDREQNLSRALMHLRAGGVDVVRLSSIYETEPVGLREQPWFLNMVCTAVTLLSPEGLLDLIQSIEQTMERVRTKRWGPRPIDIDILLCGKLCLSTPRLTVPHPRMAERAFVLIPLVEIAPEAWHPCLGVTARELLSRIESVEAVNFHGRLKEDNVPENCPA